MFQSVKQNKSYTTKYCHPYNCDDANTTQFVERWLCTQHNWSIIDCAHNMHMMPMERERYNDPNAFVTLRDSVSCESSAMAVDTWSFIYTIFSGSYTKPKFLVLIASKSLFLRIFLDEYRGIYSLLMQVLAVGRCELSAGLMVTDGSGWKPSSDAGSAGDPVQKYTRSCFSWLVIFSTIDHSQRLNLTIEFVKEIRTNAISYFYRHRN